MQMSVRCGQANASRQRPWCWHAATFPPPFFRLLASGWECWQTPLAPWRSWETSGPSMTVNKWSSSWAVAPLSPTARQKWTGRWREGSERHAGTLYIIISYMIKAHNQESPSSCDVCGSNPTYSIRLVSDWILFTDCPLLIPNPYSGGTCWWDDGASLSSEACKASSVHWEEPSWFTVKCCAHFYWK